MAGERGGIRLADQQPLMTGGLNTVSDDIALLPTQLRKAANARLTDFGAVTKRGGTKRVSGALGSASVLNGYTGERTAVHSRSWRSVMVSSKRRPMARFR